MKLHRIDEIGYVVVICECGYMLRVRTVDYSATCTCGASQPLSQIIAAESETGHVKHDERQTVPRTDRQPWH
jgi:hypothetical protein